MIACGNSFTTIGNAVIVSGLFPNEGVPSMLCRSKYFSSDLLFLQFSSKSTVMSIFSVENLELDSAIDLCVSLYFNHVHLYSINCKGSIVHNSRGFMLWLSLLYNMYVDNIRDTSKRNNTVELVSMVF